MESKATKPTTVDEYIAQFPPDIQQILLKIRSVIKESAPQAEERIGYGMPGYYQNGPLVYFAGAKNHIGFFPTGSEVEKGVPEAAAFRKSKGTLHFPLDKPIPYDLITRIVHFRLTENQEKSKYKK